MLPANGENRERKIGGFPGKIRKKRGR